MSIVSVAARGNQAYAAFGTSQTFTITTPATVAIGNTLIFSLAVDNSSVGGGSQFFQCSFTQTPDAGVWIPLGTVTNDPGAANEGVQIYSWYCKVQRALNVAETLTISCGNSVLRGVANMHELSGINVRGGPDGRVTNTGNGTTASAGPLSPTTSGDLILAVAGVESNAAITGDADVTDGAWVLSSTSASNSGVAATSVSIITQFKITTGVTAQNYAATWAGAADWAAMVISIPASVVPAAADRQENPNYPCVAGPEYLPVRDANRMVDTGTGYNVVFPFPPSSIGQTLFAGGAAFVNPNARSQHIVSLEFTDEPRFTASLSDDITTVVLPLRESWVRNPISGLDTTATDTADVSLDPDTYPGGSAAANAYILAALSTPGGNYVKFDGSTARPYIGLYFDTTILGNYVGHRVLRVGLRYLAWKDDGSPNILGEGFGVSIGDTQSVRAPNTVGTEALYGSWLVPDYERNAQYQTRWLGETNIISRNAFDPNYQNYPSFEGHPFTLVDLNRMANGVEQFYIQFTGQSGYDLLQTDTFLDYVEMVVELAPERRLLVGSRTVSNLTTAAIGTYDFDASNFMIMRYSLNPESVQALNFTANDPMVYTVRQAFPATPSDRYRVDPDGVFAFTMAEAMGPTLEMFGVEQIRPLSNGQLPQFLESVLVNGLPDYGSLHTTNFVYSAFFFDMASWKIYGPSWVDAQLFSYPTYQWVGVPGATYTITQAIYIDGATDFDQVRVLTRPGAQNLFIGAVMNVSVQQPLATPLATATITVADWEAAGADFQLGSIVDFREVIVDLSASINPALGPVYVVLSSAAADPWEVAGIRSVDGSFSYEWFEGVDSEADDAAIVLLCEMEDPDLTLTDVEVFTEDNYAPCITSPIAAPQIVVNNADEFDYIVILRSIDGSSTLTPLQIIPVDGALTIEWVDYGVPWDIEDIQYWVYGYRNSDRRLTVDVVVWAGPATAPGAAFGLTDYETGESYWYTPVAEGELDVSWSPLNPISTVQLHGVDYQIALRAPEERGLSVSTVIAIRNFNQCTSTHETWEGGETAAAGQRAFNPRPFDTVRYLENKCRLQLTLPGGHTRWVSLDLGTLNVRTSNGVYLAEITLTDLAPLSESPYDD